MAGSATRSPRQPSHGSRCGHRRLETVTDLLCCACAARSPMLRCNTRHRLREPTHPLPQRLNISKKRLQGGNRWDRSSGHRQSWTAHGGPIQPKDREQVVQREIQELSSVDSCPGIWSQWASDLWPRGRSSDLGCARSAEHTPQRPSIIIGVGSSILAQLPAPTPLPGC